MQFFPSLCVCVYQSYYEKKEAKNITQFLTRTSLQTKLIDKLKQTKNQQQKEILSLSKQTKKFYIKKDIGNKAGKIPTPITGPVIRIYYAANKFRIFFGVFSSFRCLVVYRKAFNSGSAFIAG